jgi:hypothetical protein
MPPERPSHQSTIQQKGGVFNRIAFARREIDV